MKKILLLPYFIFLFSINLNAQHLNKEELESKIESLIPATINDTTPGLVLGVIHKGELIFGQGYGLANLSYNIPNNTKMVYNIGSVSKQFLGYAFAIIQTEGRIDLDEPVSKFLEDWPEFEHEVTIRHLLSHTSGYREAYTMSGLAGRQVGVDRLSKEECLNVVRKQPKLEFIPGSRYTYNSTAWVILAEVFEKVMKQKADGWVEENILSPLGMKNSFIESYVGEVIPNAAESYQYSSNNGYSNPKSNRAIFGAADVYTSIEDFVPWINNFKTAKIGNQQAMDLFLNPFLLNDGTNSGYGFGIQNGMHKGLKMYSHTGGHESFITQLRYYPEHDLGIVSISNFGGKGILPINKLAEFILRDEMKPIKIPNYSEFEMDNKQLQQFEGNYISPNGNKITNLKMIDDSLCIWGDYKLIPISKDTFYTKRWGGKFYISTENGADYLEILGDSKSTYNKVEPWAPNLKELKNYVADYWSEELETVYHLVIDQKQLVIQHRWLGEIRLNPISKDFFKSNWGWYLKVIRNDKKEIVGFNMSSGRTLNVLFKKK
jgi:CubicO group peptidase (beta-lactamase class C family)